MLLVGNDNIINLYKRYKDIETKELTEDIQADKTPELSSLIQSMKVLNEMFFDLTKDENKTRSAMVDKDFNKHYKSLKQNILALDTINNDLNINDGEGGKNDYWSNQKKLVGKTQLTELKKTMENK